MPCNNGHITPGAAITSARTIRDQAEAAPPPSQDQVAQALEAMKPLMSLDDVAQTLGVSSRTVESLIGKGKLRPLWIKGQQRFHPDIVAAYLRQCEKRSRASRQKGRARRDA